MTKASKELTVSKMTRNCTVGGFHTISKPGRPPDAYVASYRDAHLYAASSDLLEACKSVVTILNYLNKQDKWAVDLIEKCTNAISKAEGYPA